MLSVPTGTPPEFNDFIATEKDSGSQTILRRIVVHAPQNIPIQKIEQIIQSILQKVTSNKSDEHPFSITILKLSENESTFTLNDQKEQTTNLNVNPSNKTEVSLRSLKKLKPIEMKKSPSSGFLSYMSGSLFWSKPSDIPEMQELKPSPQGLSAALESSLTYYDAKEMPHGSNEENQLIKQTRICKDISTEVMSSLAYKKPTLAAVAEKYVTK